MAKNKKYRVTFYAGGEGILLDSVWPSREEAEQRKQEAYAESDGALVRYYVDEEGDSGGSQD